MADGATVARDVPSEARDAARAMRKVVYTCTFDSYDNLMSPLARTPGTPFLHFSDRAAPLTFGWRFRPLPGAVAGWPQNEANRYCKLLPHRVLPDVDLSIYIDGNILVLGDLTPLIEEFVASDADLALFPGENNRTVEEEILLVLKGDRLSPERAVAAKAQLAEYRRQGGADLPITMNGILFRRHGRARLDRLMEEWWEETRRWAMRDQFSLPPLLAASDVTVHSWNWQYFHKSNPYFSVKMHRVPGPRRWGALSDAQAASLLRAPYSRVDRTFQRYVVAPLRRVMGRPPVKETFLRPAAQPLPKGD
ncbi:DUF616 domain-containing protein [Rhodovulum sp. 12E13]|uniref:glycosyltransferase domain-containing protein n=1 Tax=Rhodovulum sp. 12E13 TaxID=2203891 RepID=UPI000E176029|nr:glycosyltransferase domain-containing protein [Rhodovulum sp. 12E13]RDC71448.1 DUF616 domain-containing protein [Rhodovulum sp. 12E13]